MAKKPLAENIFGKIMGKIFQGKVDFLIKIMHSDKQLQQATKEVDAATKRLQTLIKKRDKRRGRQLKISDFQ